MALDELDASALAVRLQYSPHQPEPPQHAFLWLNRLEAMYGGAAGGGKSDALLMAALQYVDVPGYAALLLRKTFEDLALPGALMDRGHTWLRGTGASWNDQRHKWTFPSGASLTFGYLATSTHRYRYASAEFQFIGFDELTQFPEDDYRFLFSRLRRPADVAGDDLATARVLPDQFDHPLARVPLRMRSASNPGGRGHVWVKRRFIDKTPDPDDPEDTPAKARRRLFIPAKLEDNPHVDQDAYRQSLGELTDLERRRLLHGDWNADLGDRYYSPGGIDAAIALGGELEYLVEQGKPPPPSGGLLILGLDWGDRTWRVVLWPLEAGGAWIVDAELMRGLEPGEAADHAIAKLGEVPAWPGLGRVREPLELLEYVAYDAAGLSSQKTFNKRARRRRPGLKVVKVPFGSYKREAGLYVRQLLERAEAGHETRILAISPHLALFIAQMRNLMRDPVDEELPLKPDRDARDEERDDGPDALLAAIARIARRNRSRAR